MCKNVDQCKMRDTIENLLDILLNSDTSEVHGHTHYTFDTLDVRGLEELKENLSGEEE